MAAWSDGYVSEVGYTHGFYRELTPSLLNFIPLAAGKRPLPKISTYCELGCGQGLSANIIAAANPDLEVFATDFNASQILNARALAAEGDIKNVHFFDQSFAEIASEPSLPARFDMICLHGIYSWVSEDNRKLIIEFIRQKLAIGGLVYISYNSLPGWAAAMPLRRLMVDAADTVSGPLLSRIDSALKFAANLAANNAAYIKQNPAVEQRLEKLPGQNRNYLAHEFFNRDWQPFYVDQVAEEMSSAKTELTGSAYVLDMLDAVNFSADQQKLIAEISSPIRKELLRDFLANRLFRRDVFARGTLALSPQELQDTWLNMRLAMSSVAEDVPSKITGALGEVEVQAEVKNPLVAAFSKGPRTLREALADTPGLGEMGWAKLMQGIAILIGSGHLHPALPVKDEQRRIAAARKLNAAILKRAPFTKEIANLASPITGGGLFVGRIQQLFLAAVHAKSSDLSRFVWEILAKQNEKLLKDGAPLQSEEENLTELRTIEATFVQKTLPVLKQHAVA